MGKVYVGDNLTEIILDTTVPLGSPTTLRIKYEKPDGTTGYWDADVFEITKAKTIVQNGDLNVSGLWKFQVYAVFTSGWIGHGEEYEEWIYAPIA